MNKNSSCLRKVVLLAAAAAALSVLFINPPFVKLSRISFAQGGSGEEKAKPKPRSTKGKGTTRARPRSTTAAGNTNRSNSGARNPAAGGNDNSTRPRKTAPVGNANNRGADPKPNVSADRKAVNSNNANATGAGNPSSPIVAGTNERSIGVPTFPYLLPEPSREPGPDADILLPEDFRKLEHRVGQGIWKSIPLGTDPIFGRKPELEKPLNTTGSFAEISDKRKVFVNFAGPVGDKITTRLREYGGLEIVKTAKEADFAVNYYFWSREEVLYRPNRPFWEEESKKTVEGGTMIITTRDSSPHIPRILWRNDDTDGGIFKRGDAFDKLIKRFISELKKLRGEK